MTLNDNKQKTGKNKIWLGDDGIIRIKIDKAVNEEVIEATIEEFKDIIKTLQGKPKVLIDVVSMPFVPSVFRRKVAKIIKDTYTNPGFYRAAVRGEQTIQKVVITFALTASGVKNIKYFESEEEALEWLKEE